MQMFPQLTTGACAQYPLNRQLSQRSVQAEMEDGTILALADGAATYRRWQLAFSDLSDAEAGSLKAFFATTQGNLQPFLFLDPAANLLAWSEDFSQAAWQTAGLTFDTSVADPWGTTRASRAHNQSPADLAVAQQSQIPGMAQACFSVYLRATMPIQVSLTRSANTQSESVAGDVTSAWQRFYLSGSFPAVTDPSQFSIQVPAGSRIEIFGPQVDAQVTSSPYVTSGVRPGVYTNARFDMKQIDIIATGPNRSACVAWVRCNVPAGA